MKFKSRFLVRAGVEEVLQFHRSAKALQAISPPFVPLKIVRAPEPLTPPCTMEMKLWMGPVPIRWRAALEPLPEGVIGFLDRQVEGPFEVWRHEHRFSPEGADATWVEDTIEARLRRHPVWLFVGLLMWMGLRPMFLYRAYRTRRLLEGTAVKGKA